MSNVVDLDAYKRQRIESWLKEKLNPELPSDGIFSTALNTTAGVLTYEELLKLKDAVVFVHGR